MRTDQYAGSYLLHTAVDTHDEPKWEAEWLLPEGLTAEIIGRCYQSMMMLPAGEQPREWKVILDKALNGLQPKLRAFFPGPLDGFRSMPQGEGAQAASEELRKLLKDRVSFGDSPGLILLAYSGAIDRQLNKEIVRLLEVSDEQLVQLESALPVLRCGAYVASTMRDGELAQAVIARCARVIAPSTKPGNFLQILIAALRACSAYADRAEYNRQIGNTAAQFAYLTSRESALEMRKCLEVLCHRDLRLTSSLGRAMAVLEAKVFGDNGA